MTDPPSTASAAAPRPASRVTREFLNRLLARAKELRASDVHLRVPDPPTFRIDGSLRSLEGARLTPADTAAAAGILLEAARPGVALSAVREMDFAWSIPEVGRFRVNLFRQRGSLAAVIRLIPAEPPSLKVLGLPAVAESLALLERGLVLVTGAAGAGKSTTLAALVGHLNQHRRCHVVTIEDPIEFLHRNHKASLSQREVGSDTESFASAFRAVLRQDPDVIVVGELRDQESMDLSLRAAETGHLVLSTLHTTDTLRTFQRAVSFFPPEIQTEVRLRLADALEAILCQRLLPRADGKGRILATEVMIATPSIRDGLKDPRKSLNLKQYLEEGHDIYGTQSFDQEVLRLWKAGEIDYEIALAASTSTSEFQRNAGVHRTEVEISRIPDLGVLTAVEELELADPDEGRGSP